MIQKWEKKTER